MTGTLPHAQTRPAHDSVCAHLPAAHRIVLIPGHHVHPLIHSLAAYSFICHPFTHLSLFHSSVRSKDTLKLRELEESGLYLLPSLQDPLRKQQVKPPVPFVHSVSS